ALLGRAIKAASNDVTPRLALANYELRRGKYQEAQAAVSGGLQVSRNNPEALALQAQIQLEQGKTEDAIKTYRSLVAANASPVAYGLLAKALYLSKDQRGAEDTAKRA